MLAAFSLGVSIATMFRQFDIVEVRWVTAGPNPKLVDCPVCLKLPTLFCTMGASVYSLRAQCISDSA